MSAAAESLYRRRRLVNGDALLLSFAATAFGLFWLIWILGTTLTRGFGALNLSIFTQMTPPPNAEGGGMANALFGSLAMCSLAVAIGAPVGILAGIYLAEYSNHRRVGETIRFVNDILLSAPSIVMGLFVYVVWVRTFESFSGLAGALALACLMLPIVLRTTDEMLKLVPNELRQGSVALGAKTLRTTRSVILPTALPGIVSGALLAVARAAGETAPLIFTIGVVYNANASLFGPNTTLSAQIFRNASQPFPGAVDRAWGAALTLVALVFVLTLAARFVAARFTLKAQ